MSTNEVHPGLVETLQINNNKLPPISTEQAMGNEEKNMFFSPIEQRLLF